ncbi:Hypothetical_protein [Hexamita inflata]|uniref:Hypothetical_protein n=1 Tax=Hexamita inflata TaxID=28002 RepID=A0AA86N463_9EUKA|nr:Hypothetical protein HINF_LOCUS5 [Hexamita inflata]
MLLILYCSLQSFKYQLISWNIKNIVAQQFLDQKGFEPNIYDDSMLSAYNNFNQEGSISQRSVFLILFFILNGQKIAEEIFYISLIIIHSDQKKTKRMFNLLNLRKYIMHIYFISYQVQIALTIECRQHILGKTFVSE